MVNKISTSIKLYEDMIIREANILNKNGFVKAANLLFSLSQTNNSVPNNLGVMKSNSIPTATPPAPPQQSSGNVGGLPSMGPGMPQTPPESAPNENIPSKGISDFLKNLDTGNISDTDDLEINDDVNDILDIDDTEEEIFITEAQEIPSIKSPPSLLPPISKNIENSLKHDNKTKEIEMAPTSRIRDFDHMIDAAFSNIKISDIVLKLEDLAKIFKTREIPRQLAIVDMMLDSKGLAAYFPSLSEATNKALESNNYIATRIDDILAKLHGSIETKDIDLHGDNTPKLNSPEFNTLTQNLKIQEEKDKNRKKIRKDQSNQELDEAATIKENPEINIEEDLNKPIIENESQQTANLLTKKPPII